jgi:hypothetical protein
MRVPAFVSTQEGLYGCSFLLNPKYAYSVERETFRLAQISSIESTFARCTLLNVIFRGRPPVLPLALAASSPALFSV